MTQIDVDTLVEAYLAAGRALDMGMRRSSGATAAEWQAEDDARTTLRAARRAYLAVIRETIEQTAAYQRRVFAASSKRAVSSGLA
jgi:hypothetical protein